MPQHKVTVLSAITSTNSAPSGSAGVETNELVVGSNVPDTCSLLVYSTAGSGTMTVTIKMWGQCNSIWFPLGTHETAATKGIINEGNALAETSANAIAHAEPISYLGTFDRVYAEVTAIGGTSTAINVVIACEQVID